MICKTASNTELNHAQMQSPSGSIALRSMHVAGCAYDVSLELEAKASLLRLSTDGVNSHAGLKPPCTETFPRFTCRGSKSQTSLSRPSASQNRTYEC